MEHNARIGSLRFSECARVLSIFGWRTERYVASNQEDVLNQPELCFELLSGRSTGRWWWIVSAETGLRAHSTYCLRSRAGVSHHAGVGGLTGLHLPVSLEPGRSQAAGLDAVYFLVALSG